MALALAGKVDVSLPGGIASELRRPIARLAGAGHRGTSAAILAICRCTIEHTWHGAKEARRYVDRWSMLTRHGFDPDATSSATSRACLELAGNKPPASGDEPLAATSASTTKDATTL